MNSERAYHAFLNSWLDEPPISSYQGMCWCVCVVCDRNSGQTLDPILTEFFTQIFGRKILVKFIHGQICLNRFKMVTLRINHIKRKPIRYWTDKIPGQVNIYEGPTGGWTKLLSKRIIFQHCWTNLHATFLQNDSNYPEKRYKSTREFLYSWRINHAFH